MIQKKNLSIIIPHYNTPKLLMTAIESISRRDDFEIIVVDDNSDTSLDDLKKMIISLNRNDVTIISNNSSKKGAGACRNIGLHNSRGKWITFLDSDDYFNQNFNEIFNEYNESDYDTIFFTPTSIELDTREISTRHLAYKKILESPSNELQIRFCYPSPVSRFFRRSFLISNNIEFDEVLASNDVIFSLQVGFKMEKYKISNRTFYVITKRKGSLTQNISEEVFFARVKTFLKKESLLREKLDKTNYKKVREDGYGYFVIALKNGLGLKGLLCTFRLFKEYNQKIIKLSLFKPKKLINFIKINNNFSNDKDYKVK